MEETKRPPVEESRKPYKGMTGGLFTGEPLMAIRPDVLPKMEDYIRTMVRSRHLASGDSVFVWAARGAWLALGGRGEPAPQFMETCRRAAQQTAGLWPVGSKHAPDYSTDVAKAVKVGATLLAACEDHIKKMNGQAP